MRPEKQNITKEYLVRLNASPFFIVVNYKGLKVSHFTELRKRLTKATSELHVVKNSIFRIAAKEAGIRVKRSQIRRIYVREGVRWRRTHSWGDSSDPDFVPKERRSSATTPSRRQARRPSVPMNSAR